MSENWYIICTKPRVEKKLQAILRTLHVLNVMPTYVKVRKVQRRTVKTDIPIFPGYLMARLDAEKRLTVIKTNLTTAVLPLQNARAVLRQLHQLVKAAMQTEEFRLVVPTGAGDAVPISSHHQSLPSGSLHKTLRELHPPEDEQQKQRGATVLQPEEQNPRSQTSWSSDTRFRENRL